MYLVGGQFVQLFVTFKFKASSHTLHSCLSFQYVHYDVERPRGDSKSDVSTTLMKKGLGGEVTMIPPQVKINKFEVTMILLLIIFPSNTQKF